MEKSRTMEARDFAQSNELFSGILFNIDDEMLYQDEAGLWKTKSVKRRLAIGSREPNVFLIRNSSVHTRERVREIFRGNGFEDIIVEDC